jgi:hypothetical protein
MKRLFQILIAIVFILAGVFGAVPADAAKFYPARALTGGGEGALDAIDGALLATGDVAIIGTSDRDGYMYVLLATGDEESSPDVITPDRNAGRKRWHLVQWGGNLDLARIQAALSNDFHNIGGADDDVPEAGDLDGIFTDNGLLKRIASGSYGAAQQGVDYYAPGGTPIPMIDGGTGASLTDPDANVLWGWDDTEGGIRYITLGANLSYDPTTRTLSALGGEGGSNAFSDILTGTNTTATMTVGTGATVSYSGTGTINASQYRGVSLVDSTEFGYLDGVTSPLQAQINGKAASTHAHAGADITSGTINVARLPTGTTGTTVSLGNHTHSTYAALSHAHSGADITSGIIGAAYLPPNAYNSAGIVASGSGQANMVWKTDASGNPAWRVDSTGSAPTFDAVATGTNVSSTMTVGSGASLVRSGTGIIDANRFLGVTSIDATEFGYLDGITGSLQEQLDSKAASVHSHSAADLPLADDDGVTLGVCAFSSGGSFDVSGGIVGLNTNLTNIAANWTVDVSGNVSGMGTIEPTPTTHPQAVLYDSNAPGATTEEKAMAYLWGEYVDGADDAENSSAGIAARAAGAWFDWIWYDSSVDQVKVTRDLDVAHLSLPASTSSLASMNIPSGTSPSSPEEGDIYYDGAHLYFKPSGSAVDLLQTMVYPSGTGIATVSSGTAWGTTLTAPSGDIVGTSDTQTLTNKTLGDGTTPVRIVYDPTPATDATVSGDLISVVTTTGLNAVAGDLVYVANTGGANGPIVALADADHADKVGAVFLITESISAGNAGKALVSGVMRLDSWDWSGANKSLFISATAGDMTETIPSTAGQYVQKMGYSLSPDVILFRPSVDIGEVK